MSEKERVLKQLHSWAETLAFDVEPGATPLVDELVKRLHRQAVELGATAEELDAAELVAA